ncbi:YegS/Rv2252/BmrU family lipid kinase [Solwaraspora sp. WMMD937]|uniref:diacylglycerol/lipid kinase family protein n=1 Tax=Solwaraspora sp. WMMD937 TaxID=3016090 RepID=UPI00249B797B|nr:YegS/Rv2252/BmrU family lipid kinase [Solwaraspora sp. WMMD937]WFE21853.1 YegS/Rv2252/BmrU family lipid kinase [Solwaraspora sp. WMMD937]
MRTKQELSDAIRQRRRAVLIVNAKSRRGRQFYAEAVRRLTDAGFELIASYPVDEPGELERSLDEAVQMAPDLLIAGGGDGTIGAAARLLAHRDIALGLLPLGTTNNFARTLGIPIDLDAAVRVISSGKVIDVDLGLAGDLPFANHVGIGLSAEVMLRTPPRLKRMVGKFAYPATAAALMARHRPLRVSVRTASSNRDFQTHQLYVANGGHQAGRPITADANADDRLLVAYPVGGATRHSLLGATVRNAATGHRRTLRHDPFLAVGELLVETDRPAPVEIDGEVCGETPIRLRVDANALRVMAAAGTVDH